ncbi:hypothetical protein A3K63_04015 [Candidatus Micrarchaeota archaeon RBG_16_49_10]|nr:MAG: hypothetical protein A3K63_04015 [Candidatus Micrarchaeota archaeon RBG_16_49_10]
MEIPVRYEIDTEKFDVEFDNVKKIHVAVDKKTGEKTNISVLGILLQMGVLKSAEESQWMKEKVNLIFKRLDSIESKLGMPAKRPQTIDDEERPKRPVKEAIEEDDDEEPAKPLIQRQKKPAEKREERKRDMDILDEIEDEADRVLSKEEGTEKPAPKSTGKDIKKEIMERVLESTMDEGKKEKKSPNSKKESEEEIDNWMEI